MTTLRQQIAELERIITATDIYDIEAALVVRRLAPAILAQFRVMEQALRESQAECGRLHADAERNLPILKAAYELAPLLADGWDEYDDDEDQRAGAAACDALVYAVNAAKGGK